MRNCLIAIAIGLVLAGGWVALLKRWGQCVQPGGATLPAVLAKHPQPEERRVFAVEGREYLALFGPVRAFPRFPSGPPVYIFGRPGMLVDWTPDEGDDEEFKSRWPDLSSGRVVTGDEVANWVPAVP